jgi:hypothetical protein
MDLGGEAVDTAVDAADSAARGRTDALQSGRTDGAGDGIGNGAEATGAPAAALLATEAMKLELEARLCAYALLCIRCYESNPPIMSYLQDTCMHACVKTYPDLDFFV